MASLFIQCQCYALLVFGITGSDVHRAHLLNEILLIVAQLVYQPAAFQQSPMVVQIRRVVVACATPKSLDDFFQCLMELESNIKLPASLLHPFSGIDVTVNNFEPFLHSAYICHSRAILLLCGGKNTYFS